MLHFLKFFFHNLLYLKKYFIIYIMNSHLHTLIKEISQKNKDNTAFLLENFFHRLNASKLLLKDEKQVLLEYLISKKYLEVNPNVVKNEKIIFSLEDDLQRFEEKIHYSVENIKDLEEDYEKTSLERSKTRIDMKQKELIENIYNLNNALPEEQKLENNDYYLNKSIWGDIAVKLGLKNYNTSEKLQHLVNSYENKDFILQNLKRYEMHMDIIENLKKTCEEKKDTINKKKEGINELRETLEQKRQVLQQAREELTLSKIEDFQKVDKIFRQYYNEILTDRFIEQYEPIIKRIQPVDKLKNILTNSRNIENYLKNLEKNEKELALSEKNLKVLLKDIDDPDYHISKNIFSDNQHNKMEKLKVA